MIAARMSGNTTTPTKQPNQKLPGMKLYSGPRVITVIESPYAPAAMNTAWPKLSRPV